MDRHLSPAETAKRFGISIKALRLYEEHGLLKPLRTTNGSTGAAWRVYGPDQLARLIQILALKRVGFSLAQIGELLADEDALDPILAFQERILVEDGARITRALALVRKARVKRAAGEALSIDDLATLAQETVMAKQLTGEERSQIVAPFRQRHYTPEENASMDRWRADHAELFDTHKELMEEAKVLMTSGDTASPAAMDLARRFQANARQLRGSAPSVMTDSPSKAKALWDDIRSDPEVSQKIAPIPEVVDFVKRLVANLKGQEDSAAGEK